MVINDLEIIFSFLKNKLKKFWKIDLDSITFGYRNAERHSITN